MKSSQVKHFVFSLAFNAEMEGVGGFDVEGDAQIHPSTSFILLGGDPHPHPHPQLRVRLRFLRILDMDECWVETLTAW